MYFSDADTWGHKFGEDSSQVSVAIAEVDRAVGMLLSGLSRLGTLEETHVVVLGDHGMADLCLNKRIVLDELLMRNERGLLAGVRMSNLTAFPIELGPMLGLWAGPVPLNNSAADAASNATARRLFAERLAAGLNASAAALGFGDALQVFPKWGLPPRLEGYGSSSRVWDVVGLLSAGYQVVTLASQQQCLTTAGAAQCDCGGSHGYDNRFGSMGALFAGRGPRFPAGEVRRGWTPNVEVYNLLAEILGIAPAPNNGTAGLAQALLLPRP